MEGEQEHLKTPLDIFREEIGEKIRRELIGEATTSHFLKIEAVPERQPALSPEDLTEADRIIYEEIKAGRFTDEKWREYQQGIQNDFLQAREEARAQDKTLSPFQFPRFYFQAYLKNLLSQ